MKISLAYYKKTYYLRDAQGNIMATYNRTYAGESPQDLTMSFSLVERPIYGSSRIANFVDSVQLVYLEAGETEFSYPDDIDLLEQNNGTKHFELTNHLGNVMAVVTDKRLPILTGTYPDEYIESFQPELLIAKDYYPFGMEMSGRYDGSNPENPDIEYRYGFQGQEKDDEWTGQTGSTYDFGARLYDARIGRWMVCDKLSSDYPSYTPYGFSLNSPIMLKDEDGNIVVDADGNPVYRTVNEFRENQNGNTYEKWEMRQYFTNEGNPIYVKTFVGVYQDVQRNVKDYNSKTGEFEINTITVSERVEGGDIEENLKYNCHGFAYFGSYGIKTIMGSEFYIEVDGVKQIIKEDNVKTLLNDDYTFITNDINSPDAKSGMVGTFINDKGQNAHSNIYNGDGTFTSKDGSASLSNTRTMEQQSGWGDFEGLFKKEEDLKVSKLKTDNGKYNGSEKSLQKKVEDAKK